MTSSLGQRLWPWRLLLCLVGKNVNRSPRRSLYILFQANEESRSMFLSLRDFLLLSPPTPSSGCRRRRMCSMDTGASS
uniref:Uncharacterized protein n=1 Tax=Lepeophtheirus salmonis TaxID=72036 RepID=A0A0K2TLH3_LEPSM